MLDDNLNTRKLRELIGEARFENTTRFKDFLKPLLLQHLALRNRRMLAKPRPEKGRYDLQIFDNLTNRETLLLIGLKTVSSAPQLTDVEINAFQEDCKAVQALYGVLMTETEARFYEFKYKIEKGLDIFTEINEIPDIRPLNHIDAEFERVITKQKVKDLLISRKKTVIAALVIFVLLIASNLAQNSICKSSGEIKASTNSRGEKIYYTPTSSSYKTRQADRRYCSEGEAQDDGYVKGN